MFSGFRVGAILVLFFATLSAINQLSLFVAPCNNVSNLERQYDEEYNAANYKCSSKNGVVVEGIFLVSEIRPEWWGAISSFFIALFTLTLWIATDRMWRTSERHARHVEQSLIIAKASADAASRQADAFIAVESPTPVFSGFKIVERLDASGRAGGRDPVTAVPMPEFLQALIWPINIGRAPLRIIRICIEYDIGESLPERPFYYSITGTNIVLRNIDPGSWLIPEAVFQLDQTQRQDIDYNRKSLWVYGFLSYLGLLGEVWNLGFSARWNRHSGSLVQAGPQGYNYNRKAE
jgi:hypothetical protein